MSEGDPIAWLSREGLPGREDLRVALQVYHEVLPHYLVTPPMYHQAIPESAGYLLPPSDDKDMVEYLEEEPEEEPEEDPEKEFVHQEEEPKEEFEEDLEENPQEEGHVESSEGGD